MANKAITCFFCFEQFEVSLEISTSFNGNNIEIYDCEVCCNPNKLDYVVYNGEIKINNVSDGNEWIIKKYCSTVQAIKSAYENFYIGGTMHKSWQMPYRG